MMFRQTMAKKTGDKFKPHKYGQMSAGEVMKPKKKRQSTKPSDSGQFSAAKAGTRRDRNGKVRKAKSKIDLPNKAERLGKRQPHKANNPKAESVSQNQINRKKPTNKYVPRNESNIPAWDKNPYFCSRNEFHESIQTLVALNRPKQYSTLDGLVQDKSVQRMKVRGPIIPVALYNKLREFEREEIKEIKKWTHVQLEYIDLLTEEYPIEFSLEETKKYGQLVFIDKPATKKEQEVRYKGRQYNDKGRLPLVAVVNGKRGNFTMKLTYDPKSSEWFYQRTRKTNKKAA